MRVQSVKIVYLILTLITTGNCLSIDDEVIRQYEALISDEINKSNQYVLPQDYRQFSANASVSSQDFGSYAFIVIGAGATGSVVINRISEIFKDEQILLLEAGTYGNNFTDIPAYNYVTHYSDYNYGFYTVPQQHSCQGMINKQVTYPRGKGIGGTTLINGLVYAKGNPIEFDKLGAENPGWSYNDVLPLFKQTEDLTNNRPDGDFTQADMNFHGETGEVSVEFNGPFRQSRQVEAFVNAHLQLGINLTDYNGRRQIGVSSVQVNTISGRRDSAGKAFIQRPQIASRQNLTILTTSFVTRLLIDNCTKTVTGVEFTYKGVLYTANVTKEIILSAGVIGTPQILLLSGIGPKYHLQRMGIQCKHNLPVGKNLRDHVGFFGMCINSNASESSQSLAEYIKEYLNGESENHLNPRSNALSFCAVDNITNSIPDFELVLVTGNNLTTISPKKIANMNDDTMQAQCGLNANAFSTFSIAIVALHPRSTGSLKLKSNNPFDFPLIDPNSLSDSNNEDIGILYRGVQMVLKLLKTDAFKKINATYAGEPLDVCKSFEFLSKDYWYCAIRQMAAPAWHAIGTCPMGSINNRKSVVDHKLKVRGIKRLRIADASIIPFTLSNHPTAFCMIIGEKVAKNLHDEYKKV